MAKQNTRRPCCVQLIEPHLESRRHVGGVRGEACLPTALREIARCPRSVLLGWWLTKVALGTF